MSLVHPVITDLALGLKAVVDTLSIAIIGIGVAVTSFQLIRTFFSRGPKDYFQTRFALSRSLMLALEFLIAADILVSTVVPTWDQLGKLGVIVLIRILLNYFLGRDILEYERLKQDRAPGTASS